MITLHPDILLVEDNKADIVLMREAFKTIGFDATIETINDGQSALSYLSQVYGNGRCPRMVILDINLPKLNGLELLAKVRSDTRFGLLPIVIMSSSSAEHDIKKAYKESANCYIVKPTQFDQLVTIAKSINDFWLSVVAMPTEFSRT